MKKMTKAPAALFQCVLFYLTVKRPKITYSLIEIYLPVFLLLLPVCIVKAQVSVVTQHNNNARTGGNTRENKFTVSNVTGATFGKIGRFLVDDQIYAQPLVVSNLNIPGKGVKNVLFVATVSNSVYAFDADLPGSASLWKINLNGNGIPVNSTDLDAFGACGGNYKDFSGNIGIVGTPAIDTVAGMMYLVTRTREGKSFIQRLHAISIKDGTAQPGSPVTITASVKGTGSGSAAGVITFNPLVENQRPGLLLVNGAVYIAWGGHCDAGPYHGWVMAYNASTLQQTAVYNDSRNGVAGGIWMSGQGPAADENGNIYVISGNGNVGYNGNPKDSTNLGDSFIKLTGSLAIKDWFTPYNYQYLMDKDLDLGGSGPVLIPNTSLLVGGGKEGVLYVLNRDNMGRLNSQANDNQIVQKFLINAETDHIHGSTVYYNGAAGEYIYVWLEFDNLKAYKFDRAGGKFITPYSSISTMKVPKGMPGGMLSVSSNGTVDGTGILWATHPYSGDANWETTPGIVRAFDARNVSKELWNSKQDSIRDDVGSFAKFNCPTIANGKVYCASFSNKVVVYGLLNGNPVALRTPENPQSTVQGLDYSYYQGVYNTLPDFSKLNPVKTGTTSDFNISPRLRNDSFAFQFWGYINIPVDGNYAFYTQSDEGSRLYIGDELVVDNDRQHATQERWGAIGLKAGKHAITVGYFEYTGTESFSVSYSGPGISRQVIPATALYRVSATSGLRDPENPANAVNGLDYSYYEGSYSVLPDFTSLVPAKTGTVTTFDLSPRLKDDYFAFMFRGYINVPSDGLYTFYTSSDDGSKLYIGNQTVVYNDSLHAGRERSGTIGLKAGKHALTVGFFEYNGGQSLTVSYSGPGISKQVVPATALYRISSSTGLRDPDNPANTVNGINYSYYEGTYSTIPNTASLTPVSTGTEANFSISPAKRNDYFVFKFTGYVNVNNDGVYTFYTNSDDGSNLYIGSQLIVNNDGLHGAKEVSGTIGLKAGKHAVTVNYLEYTGNQTLTVSYAGPSLAKQAIPDLALYRVNAAATAQVMAAPAMTDSIGLSPNPVTEELHIYLPGDIQAVNISVADIYSHIYIRERRVTLENGAGKIYLGNLPPGLYVLYIQMDNGTLISRSISVSE